MKRFLFLVIFILWTYVSFAQLPNSSSEQKQWFIQISAFSSIENALNFQSKSQNKLDELYSLEREFANYVSIHPYNESYRVLLGPYITKEDAESTQTELIEEFPRSIVINFNTSIYFNYQFGYQFTWHEIDASAYKKLLGNSLLTLNLDGFVTPALGKRVSLIAHTQIQEEIFDLEEAKQLLDAENFILIQNDSLSTIIDGYKINNEEFSTGWPYFFYAYYPTENLIVFMGEGENLMSLTIDTGEWTLKMPYNTLYSPDKILRITGESSMNIGYERSFIEFYDEQNKHYVELIDLGILSPYLLETGVDGLAWISNNELIFKLSEQDFTKENYNRKVTYYKVVVTKLLE